MIAVDVRWETTTYVPDDEYMDPDYSDQMVEQRMLEDPPNVTDYFAIKQQPDGSWVTTAGEAPVEFSTDGDDTIIIWCVQSTRPTDRAQVHEYVTFTRPGGEPFPEDWD